MCVCVREREIFSCQALSCIGKTMFRNAVGVMILFPFTDASEMFINVYKCSHLRQLKDTGDYCY